MDTSITETRRAEVVVLHPPIEVWHALTRPGNLSYWIADHAEIDLRVGGVFNLRLGPQAELRARIERLVEGRRLVLRPTNRLDDARIEIDLIKLAAAETRVCVDHPDPEHADAWHEALENLRSVWETGVDLREARRGVLGVGVDELVETQRPFPGVPEGIGARLTAIVEGGPADLAGLRRGDIVVAMDNAPVRSGREFAQRLQALRPGTAVRLEAVREGQRRAFEATLAERPGRRDPAPAQIEVLRAVRESIDAADRALAESVQGLGDADAYRPEAAGHWSVAQVLAHLSVSERMLQCWLDEAIRGGRPLADVESCSAPWKLGAVLSDRPGVAELLVRVRRDEAETLAMLEGVPADVVAFKARWARVAHTALDYHGHSTDHLAQIARIRMAIGA